jgi:hypothetical protein
MRSLLIQIADERPDLIPETEIEVEDYGLHSWRKMGTTLTAAAGMHDYEVIGVRSVEEPLVHKVRPGGTRRGRTCAAGTRPESGASVG